MYLTFFFYVCTSTFVLTNAEVLVNTSLTKQLRCGDGDGGISPRTQYLGIQDWDDVPVTLMLLGRDICDVPVNKSESRYNGALVVRVMSSEVDDSNPFEPCVTDRWVYSIPNYVELVRAHGALGIMELHDIEHLITLGKEVSVGWASRIAGFEGTSDVYYIEAKCHHDTFVQPLLDVNATRFDAILVKPDHSCFREMLSGHAYPFFSAGVWEPRTSALVRSRFGLCVIGGAKSHLPKSGAVACARRALSRS